MAELLLAEMCWYNDLPMSSHRADGSSTLGVTAVQANARRNENRVGQKRRRNTAAFSSDRRETFMPALSPFARGVGVMGFRRYAIAGQKNNVGRPSNARPVNGTFGP